MGRAGEGGRPAGGLMHLNSSSDAVSAVPSGEPGRGLMHPQFQA